MLKKITFGILLSLGLVYAALYIKSQQASKSVEQIVDEQRVLALAEGKSPLNVSSYPSTDPHLIENASAMADKDTKDMGFMTIDFPDRKVMFSNRWGGLFSFLSRP